VVRTIPDELTALTLLFCGVKTLCPFHQDVVASILLEDWGLLPKNGSGPTSISLAIHQHTIFFTIFFGGYLPLVDLILFTT